MTKKLEKARMRGGCRGVQGVQGCLGGSRGFQGGSWGGPEVLGGKTAKNTMNEQIPEQRYMHSPNSHLQTAAPQTTILVHVGPFCSIFFKT